MSNPVTPFGVRAEQRGAVRVLRVHGEVDLTTASSLDMACAEAAMDQPEVLVIDLTGVTFLGTLGLTTLLAAHRRALPGGLRIVAADRPTWRPLELTGLTTVLAVYRSLDDALTGAPSAAD